MRAIFLSYRRDDAEGQAGRLFDDLTRHFGEDAVFMDVAAIDAGRDFRRAIDEQVASCGVLLAIIGKSWLTATDGSGARRLDDPKDFVRLETASALKRDIPVVPVLVHGARMPRVEDLPEDLKDLAFRNGVELTHARWDSDVEVLMKALRPYVQTTQVPTNPRPQSTPSEQGQSRPGLSRMIIAVLVGVLVVAIGGYLWYQKSPDVNARETAVLGEKGRAATAGEEEAKAEPEGMKKDEAEPDVMKKDEIAANQAAALRPNTMVPSRPQQKGKTRTVFADFFVDNRNSWLIWPSYGSAHAEIKDGVYEISPEPGNGFLATRPISLHETENFTIESRLQKREGPDSYFYGLVWGLRNENNFYNFDLTGDGHFAVTRKQNGNFYNYVDPPRFSPYIHQGDASNTLGIKKEGNQIEFLVNGHSVYSTVIDPFFGPNIGFITYNGVQISVEDLVVTQTGTDNAG